MACIETLQYESWEEFKSKFIRDLFHGEYYLRNIMVFRGQRDCDWRLTTSFDRWFEESAIEPSRRSHMAKVLLTLFRKECEMMKVSDKVLESDEYLTVLGQHFGLPTRLLDWTDSIYVAAFFAFCDAASCTTQCSNVAIWGLRLQSHIWDDQMGVKIIDAPTTDNDRLRNQAGKFTLSNTPFAHLEDYVEHFKADESPLVKILLPMAEARIALADLDAMGINHARVYPDLSGCALAAKMRILLDHASAA